MSAISLLHFGVYSGGLWSLLAKDHRPQNLFVAASRPWRAGSCMGYALVTVMMLSSGVALGSWWSTVAVWPLLALLTRRTLVEDRFLREHLAGYSEYARRVRYRLVPAVW